MPTPSLLIVPARFKSGKLYSQLPTSGAGDFTVTRATEATRVNASGFIESVASGIPRLDYFASGGTVGCPALLVEPSGTNSIRNNSMIGAVTGTPGTLPTGGGWANSLIGLTQTVVDFGTENGIAYIDIKFSGTATSTNSAELRYESTTQIVASSGQTWSHSAYLKKIAEPNPPNNYQLNIYERTSGGVYVANGASTVVPTTTNLQRFSQTRTLSGGTTARVQPCLFFGLTSGSSYDFTIRIGYPQMEQSSVATSVIPTTTGSITRNADVISVSGAVSGSIGQTEGTIYAEVDVRNITAGKNILSTDDGNSLNRVSLFIDPSPNRITAVISSGGTGTFVSGSVTAGVHKIAVSYASGDVQVFLNGAFLASGVPTLFPSVTRNNLSIGGRIVSGVYGAFLNDRIRAAALYTTRLTNDQLAALTTP